MTPEFRVETTPHFDRLFRKLAKKHPELIGYLPTIRATLQTDPYNHNGRQAIKKLSGSQVDGQWRLRLGRFRFRYDITSQTVELKYVGLRREDTYR